MQAAHSGPLTHQCRNAPILNNEIAVIDDMPVQLESKGEAPDTAVKVLPRVESELYFRPGASDLQDGCDARQHSVVTASCINCGNSSRAAKRRAIRGCA
jgi:hypothetical protein